MKRANNDLPNRETDHKLIRFLKVSDIRLLGILPPISAILILIVLLKVWGGNPTEKQLAFAGINTAMLISLTGLLQIYRREAPGIGKSFRGFFAVLSGTLIVALFWLLAIYLTIISALYWFLFLWLFFIFGLYFLYRLLKC